MKRELELLEQCIISLKKKKGLLKQKNAALEAKVLFLMIQGAETNMFLTEEVITVQSFKEIYMKVFDEFEQLFKD
jgi:hypothetical protein